MNNPVSSSAVPPPRVVFGPNRRLTLGTVALTAVAVAAAVVAADPAGTLLFALAAAVLAGYAAGDVLWWPRLAVDAAGLAVRSPWLGWPAPLRLRWDEIEAIRADVRHRHGLRTSALEIEAGARLIVLTRRSLGTDPEQAAEIVSAFRSRPRSD